VRATRRFEARPPPARFRAKSTPPPAATFADASAPLFVNPTARREGRGRDRDDDTPRPRGERVRARRGASPRPVARRPVRDRKRSHPDRQLSPPRSSDRHLTPLPRSPPFHTPQDLFTLFDSIDKTADKIEGAFGAAAGAAGKAADAVSAAATVAKPFAEKAVDAAAPLLDATGKYAERTVAPLAGEAIKTVGSAAGGVAGSAANAIKSRGIDVEPVAGAAGAAGKLAGDFATTTAAPALEKFGDYLSTASPTDLAELGAGVLAAYFIAPALLGVVASSARGYAGSGAFHLALFCLSPSDRARRRVLKDFTSRRSFLSAHHPSRSIQSRHIATPFNSND